MNQGCLLERLLEPKNKQFEGRLQQQRHVTKTSLNLFVSLLARSVRGSRLSRQPAHVLDHLQDLRFDILLEPLHLYRP
jgi:hypothetical protein